MKLSHHAAVDRALQLASCSPAPDPNPRVGCVIVDERGVVIAEGYHRGAGTPHAEAAALAALDGDLDRAVLTGATAYVTLEPCAHQGRTPSCAKALILAGIGSVVYGQEDPNGLASGGANLLREAGVSVGRDDRLGRGGRELNEDWTFSVTHGRPRVTWKYAATLDGYSAALDGTSQWITGPSARTDVHRLRAEHGAILVGTGTALADDPRLTVRDAEGHDLPEQPVRAVMGKRDIPPGAKVLDDAARTLLLPTHDPHKALAELHADGVHAVWLEGGPTLAAAFLRAGLIDDIVAYLAPAFLGSGRAAMASLGIESMSGIRRFDLVDVTTLSSPDQTDIRLRLRAAATKEW